MAWGLRLETLKSETFFYLSQILLSEETKSPQLTWYLGKVNFICDFQGAVLFNLGMCSSTINQEVKGHLLQTMPASS